MSPSFYFKDGRKVDRRFGFAVSPTGRTCRWWPVPGAPSGSVAAGDHIQRTIWTRSRPP